MKLNSKQREAVEYLSGPLLVLAGPGTGKTQLLSEKVAYILKNTDTNPENILCLTFTETGAKNMRERLKTIIGAESQKVNINTYKPVCKFSLQGTRFYEIVDGFPKITKAILPSEIFDVKYRLKLDALKQFETKEDEVVYE